MQLLEKIWEGTSNAVNGVLEKIWEGTSNAVNGVLGGLDRGLTVFFGSANSRQIKRFSELARQVGELEPKMAALSDEELREQTVRFRKRLADGETLEDLLVEAFATCREAGRRFLK
nr:hypothetical protein [Pirellula sp.]